MDQSLLQDWVRNTNKMDRNSHRELKLLIDKYPYFQAAHLLLLKNLHDNQSIRFREELRNSSLYIPDRRQLFLLIQDQIKISSQNDKKDLEPIQEKKDTISSELANKEVKAADPIEKEEETDELFDLSDVSVVEQSEEIIENSDIIASSDEILELSDSRDKKEEKEKKDSEIVEKTDSDLLIASTEVYHFGSEGKLYTLTDEKNDKNIDSEEINHSFSGWMDVVEKSDENSDDIHASSEVKKDKSIKGNNLIDNFIENEPRINRNIKVVEKQEDISIGSLEENDSLMSETLATIYVKQKLFDKAIAVYDKLVLKYPEKKVYFASQIERIKKIKKQ